MAKTEPGLAVAVMRYRRELERMGIHCESILLFGSRTTGQAEEGSDIDLIVISPNLETYSARERLELLGVAAARVLEPIQALGATPEEVKMRRVSPFLMHLLDERAVVIA